MAVVFPDQIACLENIRGEREIPDHPLVRQTIGDCLDDTMDIAGLERHLTKLEKGRVRVSSVDLTDASPLSREIINARPYAFLDDGEAENRRTRAIRNEPDDLASAATLRIISVEATDQVRAEAWIAPRSADELHDGLMQMGFLTRAEFTTGNAATGAPGDSARWPDWFAALTGNFRACSARKPDGGTWWLAAERAAEWRALHPDCNFTPDPATRLPDAVEPDPEDALASLLRDRLAGLGPVSVDALATDFALEPRVVERAMLRLQGEGFAIAMPPAGGAVPWCERRLLARIHRYSREHRRRAVKPVAPADYLRFLARWHALDQPGTSLDQPLSQLEGWTAPVTQWEHAILGVRCADYELRDLDQRFLSGELGWFRPPNGAAAGRKVVSATPVAIVPRETMEFWLSRGAPPGPVSGSQAEQVRQLLERRGAMFTRDIEQAAGLLRPHLEEALKSLVYEGRVTADAFSPLRWLLKPERIKARQERRRPKYAPALPLGRWSLVEFAGDRAGERPQEFGQRRLAAICLALLRRYGVVFRAAIQRETLLPPWRELLYYLRRMEDRGEVRGGRFVDGFSGEQFALPEALGLLRQCRESAERKHLSVVNATDPLNLGGWLTPGPRTPSSATNRILLEDGQTVARMLGDDFEELPGISRKARTRAREMLTVVHPWRRRGEA